MSLYNKKIFITGGAGYLGKNIVSRYYDNNEIVVYSRDEAKHYYLKKQFPKIKCVIGDVRDYSLMLKSSIGCDIGIYTASLKQIEAVDQNVEESIKIIIDGAINSRKITEENKMSAGCFISTDKSRSATTLYGAMKFVAGESFIVNGGNGANLSCAIYGNVTNSTGSIIPLIHDAIKRNYYLTLYSNQMTRFMIDVSDAIDLIETSLTFNGYNIIPKLKSYKVKDLFELYSEKFGLKYNFGELRISEKLHEIMISSEEQARTIECGNYYAMHYKDISNTIQFNSNEYSSKDVTLTKEELKQYLERNEWYV